MIAPTGAFHGRDRADRPVRLTLDEWQRFSDACARADIAPTMRAYQLWLRDRAITG